LVVEQLRSPENRSSGGAREKQRSIYIAVKRHVAKHEREDESEPRANASYFFD